MDTILFLVWYIIVISCVSVPEINMAITGILMPPLNKEEFPPVIINILKWIVAGLATITSALVIVAWFAMKDEMSELRADLRDSQAHIVDMRVDIQDLKVRIADLSNIITKFTTQKNR